MDAVEGLKLCTGRAGDVGSQPVGDRGTAAGRCWPGATSAGEDVPNLGDPATAGARPGGRTARRHAPRKRALHLTRLADALKATGSVDAARERYRQAEQLAVDDDADLQLLIMNNLAYTE